DQAGNDFLSFGVDHGVSRFRQTRRLTESNNLAPVYRDVGFDESTRIPDFTLLTSNSTFSISSRFSFSLYVKKIYMTGNYHCQLGLTQRGKFETIAPLSSKA